MYKTAMACAAHGHLTPSNILLQVPPSARAEDASTALDGRHAAEMAAQALDREQCMAKIANFGLSLQLHGGPGRATEAEPCTCPLVSQA